MVSCGNGHYYAHRPERGSLRVIHLINKEDDYVLCTNPPFTRFCVNH